MLKIILERRKIELYILIGFILFMALTGAVLSILVDEILFIVLIICGVYLIGIAEFIYAMSYMKSEFNYAVGMGKTRKSFFTSNVIVTVVYMLIIYGIVGLSVTSFSILNDVLEFNIDISNRFYEYIINPIYGMVTIFLILVCQMFYFWLIMEHPRITFFVFWFGTMIFAQTISNEKLFSFYERAIKGTVIEEYSVAFIVVCLVAILSGIFAILSKKILRLKVVE
jgi:hypothetical protein